MNVSLDKIIEVVAVVRGVDISEILTRTGRRSKTKIAIAKQIVCYVATGTCNITEVEIARALSYKTHTAVIYGKQGLEKTLDVDNELMEQVTQIKHVVEYYKKRQNMPMSV